MRPSRDIDPKRETVSETRDRRRKRRNRPDPHPAVKDAEPETMRRIDDMPINPGVMLEPRGDGWGFTSPHADYDLWEKQIAVAFGTRSSAALTVFMRDLKRLCRKDWDADAGMWKPDEIELSAALGMVADIQPQNTQEAALAAQMISVHWMQQRLSRDALNNGGMVLEKQASLASKLARTYSDQLDLLRKLRGGQPDTYRQEIHVTRENHVHYHDHRDPKGNRGRPHGTDGEGLQPARIPPVRAALPSSCEVVRDPVHVARDEGQDDLPDTWRAGGRSDG